MVTFNYRVGLFGFYADEALVAESPLLNYGLQDQHLALRWVHECISEFGGMYNLFYIYRTYCEAELTCTCAQYLRVKFVTNNKTSKETT